MSTLMRLSPAVFPRGIQQLGLYGKIVLMLLIMVIMPMAYAVPSFANQTGQSCVACHAGGQFPELTPYGRMFKLTGYTMGSHGNPFSAMLVASLTNTQNNISSDGSTKLNALDGQSIIDFGSFFLAGKVSDNVGGFSQFTYTYYDTQASTGAWKDHLGSDNFDLRYADRKVDDQSDLVWGLTLHNNPTVQDVWNSTPAWGYPYVSTTKGSFPGLPASTLVEGALAQHVAGLGGYLYWDNSIYAEVSSYQTARNSWSFLSLGNQIGNPDHSLKQLDGSGVYWRLAYTKEMGAHNFMVGALGMGARMIPLDSGGYAIDGVGSTRYQDIGIDAQYQYLLAPHTFTAQVRSMQERITDDSRRVYSDGPATLNTFKIKSTYVYNAEYGASLAYARVTGSADSTAYASGSNDTGSALNLPDTDMWTEEIFWIPKQNIRLGLQLNSFTKYLGASSNYDGFGRKASDNNTTYAYFWAAF